MMRIVGKFTFLFLLSTYSLSSFAIVHCSAVDKGGHRWESGGITADHASTVALNYVMPPR